MVFQHFIVVLLIIWLSSLTFVASSAFVSQGVVSHHHHHHRPFLHRSSKSSSALFSSNRPPASSQQSQQEQQQRRRRQALLSRRGPYFSLDRRSGTVEFGSTLELVTNLSSSSSPQQERNDDAEKKTIADWLSDERGLAMSIWDPSLMTELGHSVYRLQLMTLQFVTLQLSPTVDIKMWTTHVVVDPTLSSSSSSSSSFPSKPNNSNMNTTTTTAAMIASEEEKTTATNTVPVFMLQSVGFDPRLQLLPGFGTVSADLLGMDIVVAGEMRPTLDGRGVTGRISFATTGNLPPPLLLVPEQILQGAANSISDTVAQFAVRSFQQGAIQQYRQFCRQQQMKQQQQKQKDQ